MKSEANPYAELIRQTRQLSQVSRKDLANAVNNARSTVGRQVDQLVQSYEGGNNEAMRMSRQFLKNTHNQRLRNFADTCSQSLVALYALYQANIDVHSKLDPVVDALRVFLRSMLDSLPETTIREFYRERRRPRRYGKR